MLLNIKYKNQYIITSKNTFKSIKNNSALIVLKNGLDSGASNTREPGYPREGHKLLSKNSVANERINTFPKANVQPSEDPILEIPLSEFKHILADLSLTYNLVAETIRDRGILRGRELSKMITEASNSLKATQSPVEKIILLNARTRRLLSKITEALKTRPSPEAGRVIRVCSKLQARAVQILDYLKNYGTDEPTGKRDISLDSQQARLIFKGADKEAVSRRDTIRAMRRAEALWPALTLAHRPNDGRQTMRLTIHREDLSCGPEMAYCSTWQRSKESVGLAL